MPNTIQSLLAGDLAEMIVDMGHSITWNGTAYSCLLADPSLDASLDEGGFVVAGDFVVKVPRASFTAGLPSVGDRVTHNSRVYKVMSEPDANKEGSPLVVFTIAA